MAAPFFEGLELLAEGAEDAEEAEALMEIIEGRPDPIEFKSSSFGASIAPMAPIAGAALAGAGYVLASNPKIG